MIWPLVRWAFERNPAPGLEDPAPFGQAWLSPGEQAFALGLRSGKRRVDWLRGRLLSKQLCRSAFPDFAASSLADFEILAQSSGAPVVRLPDGVYLPEGALSLSHRHDAAASAVIHADGLAVGIDIEWIEPRSDGLVRSFFTDREQDRLRPIIADAERQVLANVVWSAKEAVLKALGVGLSEDTRAFSCLPLSAGAALGDGWHPVEVVVERPLRSLRVLEPVVRWREEEGYVVSVAVLRHADYRSGESQGQSSGEADGDRAPDFGLRFERCLLQA